MSAFILYHMYGDRYLPVSPDKLYTFKDGTFAVTVDIIDRMESAFAKALAAGDTVDVRDLRAMPYLATVPGFNPDLVLSLHAGIRHMIAAEAAAVQIDETLDRLYLSYCLSRGYAVDPVDFINNVAPFCHEWPSNEQDTDAWYRLFRFICGMDAFYMYKIAPDTIQLFGDYIDWQGFFLDLSCFSLFTDFHFEDCQYAQYLGRD